MSLSAPPLFGLGSAGQWPQPYYWTAPVPPYQVGAAPVKHVIVAESECPDALSGPVGWEFRALP
eukprot:7420809-Pyramimonas_sp.AAC.1